MLRQHGLLFFTQLRDNDDSHSGKVCVLGIKLQ